MNTLTEIKSTWQGYPFLTQVYCHEFGLMSDEEWKRYITSFQCALDILEENDKLYGQYKYGREE